MLLVGLSVLTTPHVGAVFTATVSTAGRFALAADFGNYTTAVLADGPWAYHRLEEARSAAATSTAADSSGNSRPATYQARTDGSTLWWRFDDAPYWIDDFSGTVNSGTPSFPSPGFPVSTTGVRGSALVTSTDSGYVFSARAAVDTTRSFTVSAWVKTDAATGEQVALSQKGTTVHGFSLGRDAATGKWAFTMPRSDSTGAVLDSVMSDNAGATGVYVHLAGVYDDAANTINLFVNGDPKTPATRLDASEWSATGALQGGRGWWGGAFVGLFSGALDEVRVYDRALSSTEIAQLAGNLPWTSWSLSEGAGTTTADAAGADNTCNLGAGAAWTTSGKAGNALTLPGNPATGYADCAARAVKTDRSFAVSAWVYLDPAASTSAFHTAVSQKSTGSVSAFYLQHRGDTNRWAFTLPQTSTQLTGHDLVASSGTSTLGSWTHLVGVYDDSAQTLRLYVNGTDQGYEAHLDANAWTTDGVPQIGRSWHNSAQVDGWYGKVDELQTYQRALSAADVTNLYNGATLATVPSADQTAGITGALQGAGSGLQDSTGVAMAGTTHISSDQQVTAPSAFTIECWFRTTSKTGGVLVGFDASRTASPGTTKNRVLMLDVNSRLTFGVINSGTETTALTANSYNDGVWHHVAASVGADGMRIVVDGVQVGSGMVFAADTATGYWRWGGGRSDWAYSPPSTSYFQGSIDEVAVYNTQLSDVRIAAHYAEH